MKLVILADSKAKSGSLLAVEAVLACLKIVFSKCDGSIKDCSHLLAKCCYILEIPRSSLSEEVKIHSHLHACAFQFETLLILQFHLNDHKLWNMSMTNSPEVEKHTTPNGNDKRIHEIFFGLKFSVSKDA